MQLSMFHRLLLSTLFAIPSVKGYAVVIDNNCGFGTPTIVQNDQIVAVATTAGAAAVAFLTLGSFGDSIEALLQTEPCCSNDLTKVYNTSVLASVRTSGTETEIFLKSRVGTFVAVSTDFFQECPGVGTICASLSNCNTGEATCPGEADIGVTFCSDTI
ncbi:hypothetical protein C8F04DRAFT_1237615 [Mycena alexandri]|uniref:Uncharacterized protein n=1 Tax=Mycena alexandri TaxID=1745969 RepID=A0AAD6SHW9_9AGAR|nr:hypothetical protein C8F04DRAFT_1237615 [Mycena alexandri]